MCGKHGSAKKGWRHLTALLLAVLMVLSNVAAGGSRVVKAEDGSWTVSANGTSTYVDEFELSVNGNPAFCAEYKIDTFPGTSGEIYQHRFDNAADYEANSQGGNEAIWWLNDTNHWDKIRAVLYAGHPHDKAGIGASYRDTAAAVWYYTYSGQKVGDEGKAQMLIDWAESHYQDVPDSAKLYFYTKDNTNVPWQSVFQLEIKDETVDVSVEKKWVGPAAAAATVQLYADGKACGDAVTLNAANNWKYSWSGLDKKNAAGTDIQYTVDEPTAPAGYTKTVARKDNSFTITNTHTPVAYDVEISKVAVNGTEELTGAALSISSETVEGFETITWISGTESKKVKLLPGTYTLTETTAPDGYMKAESIRFTVTDKGKVTIDGSEQAGNKVVMEDAYTKVTIKKTDITGGKEIGGAVLQVKDGDKLIETWTSVEGESHEINAKLVAGKTYKLVEITAPDGYLVAEEIEFTVSSDGKVQTVVMKDDHTKVTIKKTDITGGKEIGGAVLQVKDGDKIVEEWTSVEGESHEINAKLVVGKEYTLVEITAPDGYLVAEEIKFTVNTDGKVQVVEMKDDYKDQTVKIRKVDLVKGQEVAGAAVEIFNAEGESLGQWISEEGKPIELALKPGAYTFKEVNAPVGYICVETEIAFTVDKDGSITVTTTAVEPAGAVEVVDGEILLKDELKDQTVKISKTDLGGTELEGAEIVVKDAAGKEIKSWTSKVGESMSLDLKPGDYSFQETNAPEGYECVSTEIGFRVEMDGSITVTTTAVEPAGAVEVVDGVIILKNALKEVPPPSSEEAESTESTEPDESGQVPPGGDEEETTTVNGENETPATTEAPTEPAATLPPDEEEETTTVDGENETPATTEAPTEPAATLPPDEEEETTTVDAENETPAPETTPAPAPDTGDHSQLTAYMSLLTVAAAGIFVLLTRRKKEEA